MANLWLITNETGQRWVAKKQILNQMCMISYQKACRLLEAITTQQAN